LKETSVPLRRDGGGEGGEGTSSRPAVHFCQDPQHTGGDKEALYQKPSGIQRKILELLKNNLLKLVCNENQGVREGGI
jgi:hypothetical protein